MGKALLFIIAAIGASSVQTFVLGNGVPGRAVVRQATRENDAVATQIARAGYNVAYAMIHKAATPLAGVAAVNNATNGLRGSYLGGEYRVTATLVGGTAVAVQSHGYYGGTWQGTRYVGRYVSGRYAAPSHHFIGDDR